MDVWKRSIFSKGELDGFRGKSVFITGITSPLGMEVAGLLSPAGSCITGLTRDRARVEGILLKDVEIIEGVCEKPEQYRNPLKNSAFVIHIAGMRFVPWIIRACAGHTLLERILFVSSARTLYPDRLLTKKEIVGKRELLERESEVSSSLLPWTIFRPTLIFAERDRSLSRVAKFMAKRRWVPLPGRGSAVKQPISARDFADSMVKALLSPAAHQKIYNLPGEEITVREMLETISGEMGKKVAFLRVPRLPVAVLRWMCGTVGLEGSSSSLNSFLRWYEDVRISGEAAREDFGHTPGSFRKNIREQIRGFAP